MAPPKKGDNKKIKKTTKKTTTKASKKQKQKPKNLKTLENVELDELFAKDSPLVKADLKTLIPVWFNSLPPETMATLLPLLPDADKTPGTSSPQFLTDKNHAFWNTVEHWQDALSFGAFCVPSSSSGTSSSSSLPPPPSHDESFKDDNYEAYWGERVEKDKKQKAAAIKAAKKLASGRGRGRGRGGKVQK